MSLRQASETVHYPVMGSFVTAGGLTLAVCLKFARALLELSHSLGMEKGVGDAKKI